METPRARNRAPRLASAISLILLAISSPSIGEERLKIDLAGQQPGEVVQISTDPTVNAVVEVTNRLPSKQYDVTVTRRRVSIPPLEPLDRKRGPALAEACQAIADANDELFEETAEIQVSSLRSKLEATLASAPLDQCAPQRRRAAELIAKVTVVVGSLDVRQGDEVEIRVERAGEKGPLVWRKIYSTGPPGTWLTTYGFNFVPSRDKRYFLEPAAEAGSFRILRDAERREMDFSPSVYFSWMPANWKRPIRIGPTAGLGFDLSAPIVFAGMSILYNWNIGVFLGAVMHQQTRLRGEFRENTTIRQNLTSDNLVEKTYVPNIAAGVTFRFGSNPFPTRAPADMRDAPTPTPIPTLVPPPPSPTPTPGRDSPAARLAHRSLSKEV